MMPSSILKMRDCTVLADIQWAMDSGGISRRLKVRLATKLVRTDDLRNTVKLWKNPRSEIVQVMLSVNLNLSILQRLFSRRLEKLKLLCNQK